MVAAVAVKLAGLAHTATSGHMPHDAVVAGLCSRHSRVKELDCGL